MVPVSDPTGLGDAEAASAAAKLGTNCYSVEYIEKRNKVYSEVFILTRKYIYAFLRGVHSIYPLLMPYYAGTKS